MGEAGERRGQAWSEAGPPSGHGSTGRRVAVKSGGRNHEIAWALDGDMLVVRIPLSRFVRQLALKALAGI